MINEKISQEVFSIIAKMPKDIMYSKNMIEQIYKTMKKFSNIDLNKTIQSKQPIDFNNSKMERLKISDIDVVNLKKELNKTDIQFDIYKDLNTNENFICFQTKDTSKMKDVFLKLIKNEKEIKKPSLKKELENKKKQVEKQVKKDKNRGEVSR